MTSPKPVDDQTLFDLLEGKLSESQELELEHRIANDPVIRKRWEELSGSSFWPIGSFPPPEPVQSSALLDRMERLQGSQGDFDLYPHDFSEEAQSEEQRIAKLNLELRGFRALREVGRGGMGIVYEGIDETLQRPVAIKVLKRDSMGDKSPSEVQLAKERLIAEAQAIASLQHPNILSIYSILFCSGSPVLIEEYVDGQTLRQLLKNRGKLSINETITIGSQIAQGLHAAHNAKIIHRDLKPENILLARDSLTVRIADFGLAKREDSSSLTGTHLLVGTPSYMSPEQTLKISIDHRSDLFSLGVLLYVMLTGVSPFDHSDVFVVLDKIRHHQAPSVKALRPDTPAWLSALIETLLEKLPYQRVQTAEAVANSLISGKFPTRVHAPHTRFGPWFLGATVLLTLLGLSLSYLYFSRTALSPTSIAPSSTDVVSIDGHETNYVTVSEAIEAASDGDTIFIGSDLSESGIQVRNKKITLAAKPGTKPTIRFHDPLARNVSYFLRTNNDLTLRGLKFEWDPPAMDVKYEDGQFLNMISTVFDTDLLVENCEFSSSIQGTVLGIGGNATILQSTFLADSFAICSLICGNQVRVVDSLIDSKNGVAMTPYSSAKNSDGYSRIRFERTCFVGESALSFYWNRPFSNGIEVTFHNSEFRTGNVLTIQRSGIRVPAWESPEDLNRFVYRTFNWKETDCIYHNTPQYVAGRLTLNASKDFLPITNLKQWSDFWSADPNGGSFVQGSSLK